MNAAILTIGDEILNGQTLDTNSAWLGKELNKIGVSVSMRLSVGDNHNDILEGLDLVFSKANLVIVTGGLGPTKDDVTKKALAEYFDDEMIFDESTYKRIQNYFEESGRHPTEAHRQQSFMPSKATLLINNRGTAPGMWFSAKEKTLLSVPGVPTEMKGILMEKALDKIAFLNSNQHINHYIIQTVGLSETYIAEQISDITEDFPEELTIAFLPGLATVKLRVTGIGHDAKYLKDQTEYFGKAICNRLGEAVFGIGDIKLEEAVGVVARDLKLKIGTAESCTGGRIAQMITSIAGSSNYYKGSVISYDNEVKTKVLKVSKNTLERFGAVSGETVIEMINGLIDHLSVDVAVAVSGIAGPSGGTPSKPVGTIWIAVGNKEKVITKKIQLSKNRLLNIHYSAVIALNELRLFMIKGN